ncbi:hypothetical protein [Saliterribacillus persicus]|uniref:Uncharacterized protein n=1 Tax=Saliterribacillus persicus TaxID=930114 RepID=A0A368X7A5_9BACI|nr:hypothetical protein [Saliterribacillus persicus]RCW63882.1 hypothetical protein DFR57_1157 [Saliterribacillus persicus]
MKKIIIGITVLLGLWLILDLANINTSYVIPTLIEWPTKFILPWIFLYWFVRLVKTQEK